MMEPTAPPRPGPRKPEPAPATPLDMAAVRRLHRARPDGACAHDGQPHPCHAAQIADVGYDAVKAAYAMLDTLVTQYGIGHPLVKTHLANLRSVARRVGYEDQR